MGNKKFYALYFVIAFIAIFGVTGLVAAYSSYTAPKIVNEAGGIINYNEVANSEATPVAPELVNIELGAMPGNRLTTEDFIVNSVRQFYRSQSPRTATTTICALKGPTATSTLVFGSVSLTTGSSTNLYVEMGKGATAYATTTSLGSGLIVADAQDTFVASTTPTAAEATIFGPSEWFVVKAQGGLSSEAVNAVNFAPVGKCKAEWIENL